MEGKTFQQVYGGNFLSHWDHVARTKKPVIAVVNGYAVSLTRLNLFAPYLLLDFWNKNCIPFGWSYYCCFPGCIVNLDVIPGYTAVTGWTCSDWLASVVSLTFHKPTSLCTGQQFCIMMLLNIRENLGWYWGVITSFWPADLVQGTCTCNCFMCESFILAVVPL